MTRGRQADPPIGALHPVSASEVDLVSLRERALELFDLHYPNALSHRTMRGALRRVARQFSQDRCDERSFPWELLVDIADVTAMQAVIAGAYSRKTVARDMTALRLMLRCCWKAGLLTHAQWQELTDLPSLPPAAAGRPGYYLTDDDVRALLDACVRDTNPVKGARDYAALMTALSTGVRRHELVAILISALDLTGGFVHLTTTKGGVPRTGYLHSHTSQALSAWLALRGSEGQHVFTPVTRGGRILTVRALSAHRFWKMLRERCAQAGLPAEITPHDLRRYTVSQLLGTTDIALVARVVGHHSPAVTATYDRRPDQQCRAAVETLALPSPSELGARREDA